MKKVVLLALVCVLLGAFPSALRSVDLRAGSTILYPRTERVTNDILAAGNQVTIEPSVPGDVTAAGSTVTVSGPVRDSILLSGGNVTVSGRVGNDAWIAGGIVTLNAPIADNAYLTGGNVTISRGADVGTDLFVAGGTVSVMGNVGRNLRVAGGSISIGGTVGGNVYASSGESIRILDGAVIRGNFLYKSPKRAVISPGAKILGQVRQTVPPIERRAAVLWSRFVWWLGSLLAAILFGIALVLLFPVRTSDAANMVVRSFLPSVGIGILILIAVPVACIILMITLIGIPLALAFLAIYLVLLYAAKIFVALAIGRWVLGTRLARPPHPILLIILGLVILGIVELVPFLGALIWFVVLITGLGAFAISWWRSRETGITPPEQPAQAGPSAVSP